ncbi:50S ribosomal protein L18 [bacterium]|nr:50S ribosomal protein L18 [candidate division CSSED10-310 bacterium]
MKRQARQRRTRLKIRNSLARPRLAVHRTSKHMYAQVIDDATHRTLVSSSTMSKEFRAVEPRLKGKKAAEWVGKDIAEKAKAAGVTTAVLDRGQYLYHGRIKALADAARGNGLIL